MDGGCRPSQLRDNLSTEGAAIIMDVVRVQCGHGRAAVRAEDRHGRAQAGPHPNLRDLAGASEDPTESSLVRETLADTPVTVIQGARQVGKSTLMRQVLPGTSLLTLDDAPTLEAAKADPVSFVRQSPEGLSGPAPPRVHPPEEAEALRPELRPQQWRAARSSRWS